jgi:nucleoside-diphosphate-sugar epimerase
VDLLDASALAVAIADADPTHLVHLAGRTDLAGLDMDDYRVNTEGTRNVLDAALIRDNLERIIVTSSLLVCRNGYRPLADTDYCPTTAYGRSKQAMEEQVRETRADDDRWVLVRPTSIWGPWFGNPYRRFFETVLAGRYVHPGRPPVTKALGFVTNTVAQIDALLTASPDAVAKSTFYLADPPTFTIDDWADAIADAGGRSRPRRMPLSVIKAAAAVGDLMARTGRIDPPLTRFRLSNMRTPSSYDTDALDQLTGPLPVSWREGVAETVAWLGNLSR